MDTYLKNFGPRLRRYVEQRGTIESAYKEIGVSRATLFNWFERSTPPPGEEKLDKLRRYLGKDADEFLDSSAALAEDPPTFVARIGARSPAFDAYLAFIRGASEEAMRLAGGDPDKAAPIFDRILDVWTQSREAPDRLGAAGLIGKETPEQIAARIIRAAQSQGGAFQPPDQAVG